VVRSLITISSSDGEKLKLFKEIAGVLAGLQQVRGAATGGLRRAGGAAAARRLGHWHSPSCSERRPAALPVLALVANWPLPAALAPACRRRAPTLPRSWSG
jgi:hypothetical protein